MAKPKPTAGELSVLRVLWKRGPSTVRQVLGELPQGTGYTTALKLLQIMTEKKLVACDPAERSHVFKATLPEAQTLGHLARDLLDRAFDGSTQKLLMAVLSAKRASPKELRQMRQMIEQALQDGPSEREQS